MKRTHKYVLLAVGLVIFSLTSCGPKDDKKALQELVEKAAGLAENHDIGGIIDLTTEDFTASPGDFDRIGAKRIIFLSFRRYGELNVVHPRPTVDLDSNGKGPLVSFPFLIVKKGQPLPDLKELYNDPMGWIEKVGERADLYRFTLGVVKMDGRWLVKNAHVESFTSGVLNK
ncbi:hypothetical protein ACFL2O_03100 [Thermodesulfobacteriota bacterium]